MAAKSTPKIVIDFVRQMSDNTFISNGLVTQTGEIEMLQIRQAEYDKISNDYKGTWEGKRYVFAGCIMKNGGTRFAIEGVDFAIIPTMPKQVKRRRY